jgi:EpsI family protein
MTRDLARRMAVVAVVLLVGASAIARASKSEIVPMRRPLAELPLELGPWQGQSGPEFEQSILDVLGVDEYISRSYYTRGASPLGLYIGYYDSQRQGDTMHSPLNCLPGAGWLPVEQRRIDIPVVDQGATRLINVNSFVIEKGLDRQVVLYWYQSHGRVVASEYWGRIYMVVDAMRMNRTDGALVRVIVPIGRAEQNDAAVAERTAIGFVQQMYPVLTSYLPA